MFQFERPLEDAFSQCVPFDESAICSSEDYARTARSLQAARRLLEKYAPESMADVDAYLDAYLELVDLECRHYFAEGYRLGETGAN
jgi:hypothetical protein